MKPRATLALPLLLAVGCGGVGVFRAAGGTTSSSSGEGGASTSSSSSSAGGATCDGGAAPAKGTVLWQRAVPMSAGAIVTDAASNIYLTGWNGNGHDFGDGVVMTDDGLWNVVKIGPDGHALWARAIPSSGGSGGFFRQLATDGTSVYLGAETSDQGQIVAKLDPDGNILWTIASGAYDEEKFYDDDPIVAADGTGKVYFVTTTSEPSLFGVPVPSGAGSLFFELDAADGSIVSAKVLDAIVTDLVAHPKGGVVMSGYAFSSPSTALGCASPFAGAFVAALDPTGACAWSYDAGPTQWAGTITSDGSSIYAALPVAGGFDMAAFALDGGLLWSLPALATVDHYMHSGAGPGGLALWVSGKQTVTLGCDVFSGTPHTEALLRVSPAGSLSWASSWGGYMTDDTTVSVDAQGAVVITGWVSFPTDLGAGPLASGSNGSFLVRLAP